MKIKMMSLMAFFILLSSAAFADAPKPKYGPAGAPIAHSMFEQTQYFRGHAAPDFWKLISFYVPQMTGASCSVASVLAPLNAARATLPRIADDKNFTHTTILEKITEEHWGERVSADGFEGVHGLNLDQLGRVVEKAFKENGFPNVRVEVVHVTSTNREMKRRVRQALVENERSDRDFIIANFNQKSYTDDTDAGHMSPIGAFDAGHNKVLVMDVDREWYEPYWVSLDKFVEGMATVDSSVNQNRGFVRVIYR